MKNVRILLGITLLVLLLTGCQKQGIFYWGDYSKTYYDEMKNPCEATGAAHLKTLETIIEQSKAKSLAVPQESMPSMVSSCSRLARQKLR